jgi:hypothetical protein
VSAPLKYFFWVHPEWWTLALSGTAWMVMWYYASDAAGHGLHHRMPVQQELALWLWMVAAMMLPLALDAVRLAAARSLWPRRHRAIAGFLAGYFAPWLALGIAVAALRQAAWTHTETAAGLFFAAAAFWQRTPLHSRALAGCHRTQPLAPVGWPADRDCLRFGGNIGAACVWSCWPLMLACAFTGHHWVAMVGGMAIGAAERWAFRPRTRAILASTLVLAVYFVAQAIMPAAG